MATKVTRVRCPGCQQWLKIPVAAIARTVRCTNCRAIMRPELRRRTGESKPTSPPESAPAPNRGPQSHLEMDGAAGYFDRWQASDLVAEDEAPGAFPAAHSHRLPRYEPRTSKAKFVAGGVVAMLVMAAGVIGYINRDLLTSSASEGAKAKPKPKIVEIVEKGKGGGKADPAAAAAFPRRVMVVSINQYLYANPILFGSPNRNPAALLERLASRWRVPTNQLFLLTDASSSRRSPPPIKPILQSAIESFLTTSRPQDRITLVYAGHCTVVDGKPYLVPLDGELTVKESLVPLEWLFDKLKACPARQKLLVFDTARHDPGRGLERPSPGPMAVEVEAMLKTPPAGVQVWSSCAARQHSFEYKYQVFDSFEVEGSVFLNQFFRAFTMAGPGIPKPEDPLPLDELAPKVAELTQQFTSGIQKEQQTPFLAGAMADGGAEYDPKQTAAAPVVMPKPEAFVQGGLADPALVKTILAEIKVPPARALSAAEASSVDELDAVVPFAAVALKGYQPDYANVRQLLDDPVKYPLRVGVLKAVEVLERHGRGEVMVGPSKKSVGLLREEFAGATSDDVKKSILKEQQEGPAAMYVELEDLVKAMEKLKPERDKETSKRWQAHYDYVLAMTKSRFAYINEYNLMLGKIRKDELPAIDEKLHKGWRLAAVDKMSSPRDVKDQADDARKLFNKLIKEHPGTPWEVLAKRERLAALGLAWQPAAIKN